MTFGYHSQFFYNVGFLQLILCILHTGLFDRLLLVKKHFLVIFEVIYKINVDENCMKQANIVDNLQIARAKKIIINNINKY